MSRKSQQRPPQTDEQSSSAESLSPLPAECGEQGSGRTETTRLQAIQELVQSGGYHVQPMLVAERMLQRATTEGHDRKD